MHKKLVIIAVICVLLVGAFSGGIVIFISQGTENCRDSGSKRFNCSRHIRIRQRDRERHSGTLQMDFGHSGILSYSL